MLWSRPRFFKTCAVPVGELSKRILEQQQPARLLDRNLKLGEQIINGQ